MNYSMFVSYGKEIEKHIILFLVVTNFATTKNNKNFFIAIDLNLTLCDI